MLSCATIYLCKVSWKLFSSYRADTSIWQITLYNVPKAITPKAGKQVMVLEFCMSAHGSLHFCKISLKYLKYFSSYGADTISWWTDGLKSWLTYTSASACTLLCQIPRNSKENLTHIKLFDTQVSLIEIHWSIHNFLTPKHTRDVRNELLISIWRLQISS